jgi:predicted TPR repeat methyltransferase
MLAQARAKGIYDALIESECIAYLEASVQNYDLITMIDVLPYLDDLSGLFQALQKRLTPTGLVIISSEISNTAAFALQDTLRFCHNPNYIKSLSLAHGLTCITQEIYRARQQETKTIDVMMTVLRHLDSA